MFSAAAITVMPNRSHAREGWWSKITEKVKTAWVYDYNTAINESKGGHIDKRAEAREESRKVISDDELAEVLTNSKGDTGEVAKALNEKGIPDDHKAAVIERVAEIQNKESSWLGQAGGVIGSTVGTTMVEASDVNLKVSNITARNAEPVVIEVPAVSMSVKSFEDGMNGLAKSKKGESGYIVMKSHPLKKAWDRGAKEVGLPFADGKYNNNNGKLSLGLGILGGKGEISLPGKAGGSAFDGQIRKGFVVKKGKRGPEYTIFPISRVDASNSSDNMDAVLVCGKFKKGEGKCVLHPLKGDATEAKDVVGEALASFGEQSQYDRVLDFSKNKGKQVVQIDNDKYVHEGVSNRLLTAGGAGNDTREHNMGINSWLRARNKTMKDLDGDNKLRENLEKDLESGSIGWGTQDAHGDNGSGIK